MSKEETIYTKHLKLDQEGEKELNIAKAHLLRNTDLKERVTDSLTVKEALKKYNQINNKR